MEKSVYFGRIHTFDKTFWTALSISFILIVLFTILFFWIVLSGYADNLQDKANVGNTLNGVLAPFMALLATVLTFLAFWVQFKSNIVQRKDIAIERFENSFFELLKIHQNIISDLSITIWNEDGEGADEVFNGRDVFDGIYNHIPIEFSYDSYEGFREVVTKYDLNDEKSESIVKNIYKSDELIQTLDHYFVFTKQLFDYVDKNNVIGEEDKRHYCRILSSTFNIDELLMLCYHGVLVDMDLKYLIEKYAVLKNIRKGELGNINVLNKYEPSAFKDN